MEIEQNTKFKYQIKGVSKYHLTSSNSTSLKLYDHSAVIWGENMYIWGGDNRQPKVSIRKQYNFHKLRLDNHTWETIEITGSVPPHVHSHSSTLMEDLDSQMFVFGGSTQDHKSVGGLWGYNLLTKTWRKILKGPSPRQSSSMVMNKCLLLIYGGVNLQLREVYNQFHVFDTRLNNWYELVPNQKIPKRTFQKMVSICQQLTSFLFGGSDQQGGSLNDFYKIEIFQRKNCKIQKIQTKIQPPPRIGHGMLMVQNKNVLIIGGQKQLRKKAELLRDAWMYSIDNNEWLQIDLKNKFESRSHFSIGSHRNQIIIYGGIKNDGVDDEMLVLQIDKVDENKKENQSCKYKKPIDGERVSFQFLLQAANLIKFPFAAIGLLVDNAIQTQANLVNISINDRPAPIPESQKKMTQKQKISQNPKGPDEVLRYILIEDDGKPWSNEQLPSILFNTQINDPILLQSTDRKYRSLITRDNLRKEFGNNLKLGSLRLGRAFLHVSYYESYVRAGLLMPNFESPDETQFTTRYYCEDIKQKQFLTPNGASIKRNIEWITKHFLKHRALDEIGPLNQLYVFQLRHYCTLQGIFYELNPYNNDCIYYYLRQLQFLSKLGFPIFQCPDVSLRSYLSLLYLKMQTKITLQTDKKSKDDIQNQLFLDKIDQQREKGYVKQIEYANEYPELAQCKIVELYFDQTMNEERIDTCFHSGILIYYKNRLISRYKYELGLIFQHKFYRKRYCKGEANVFQFFGYIELPDSINVNIVKTDVTNPILLEGFNSNIRLIIKDMKRRILAKSKPSLAPTVLQVHDQGKLDQEKHRQLKHVQRKDKVVQGANVEQDQDSDSGSSDSDSEYQQSPITPIDDLIEDIKRDEKQKNMEIE